MKDFVLDTSAVLRFTDNEPGADRVEELLALAERKMVQLYMSPVNWGEVVYNLMRHTRRGDAGELKRSLHARFPAIDDKDAELAGQIKGKVGDKLGYADCFAAMLADGLTATLVTADYGFKVLSPRLQIEFLPKKP
ncbi:MAG TPA: PIN domain-containing protein [Terriglobales bacterium]|nr:PIN domain-containing protein [Terriglobales bacterium]